MGKVKSIVNYINEKYCYDCNTIEDVIYEFEDSGMTSDEIVAELVDTISDYEHEYFM